MTIDFFKRMIAAMTVDERNALRIALTEVESVHAQRFEIIGDLVHDGAGDSQPADGANDLRDELHDAVAVQIDFVNPNGPGRSTGTWTKRR